MTMSTSGGTQFFSDSGCGTSLASGHLTIAASNPFGIFYTKSAASEGATLTATKSGLTSGTFNLLTQATQATMIASTSGYTTCVAINGDLKCAGSGANGRLGNGGTTDSMIPVQVSGLTSGVLQVASTSDATCALTASGIQCWGYGAEGEIGNGSGADQSTPQPVSVLGANITQISGVGSSFCALQSGSVYCWGRGNEGELGVGDTSGRNVPTQVTLPDSATQISVGAGFACAILANTQLWCWGASYGGVFLSQGDSTVPQQITGIPGTISDLSAGCDMMSVIIAGTTYYWGGNQWWGNYVQDLGMTGTYTQIVSVGIVGGAFAIRNDGSVWCDSFGVYCGDGSTNQGVIESNITSGATFVMSANGGACAIVTLGGQPTLECWGSGLDGSLGTSPQLDGSVDPVVTPFDTFSWN